MSVLKASRSAQWPLVAEFVFNFDDTMVNTAGNTVDFGLLNPGVAAGIFEIIALPYGAEVIGGQVFTTTEFDTAGFTIKIGDSVVDDRYLGATDAKAAAFRTPLVPTGYVGLGENIRLTFDCTDVCTTGKMTVQVKYVIRNRSNEVQIT